MDLFFASADKSFTAGVDEVGRGPAAGPVVACALILPIDAAQRPWAGEIRDSKKLSAKRRDYLFDLLRGNCAHAVAEASVEEIDRINILEASLLAMKRAVDALPQRPSRVLVDGNKLPRWDYPSEAIVGGDGKIMEIAAASIIAKVTRDRMMKKLSEEFPHYGWDKNAGYPAAAHLRAIETHGVTPHHRKSWAPVARILNKAA